MKTYELSIKGKDYKIKVKSFSLDAAELEIDGETLKVDVKSVGNPMAGKKPTPLPTKSAPASKTTTTKAAAPNAASSEGGTPVNAPIPGAIMEVYVKVGDDISRGKPVVKMEAMKMENIINAPQDGKVISVSVNAGDAVSQGAELISIA